MKIIYSMYRAGVVSVHRACCERATQPYSLGGGGGLGRGGELRVIQAQDQQVLPHVVNKTGPGSVITLFHIPHQSRGSLDSRVKCRALAKESF